jgi:hypothetical protein
VRNIVEDDIRWQHSLNLRYLLFRWLKSVISRHVTPIHEYYVPMTDKRGSQLTARVGPTWSTPHNLLHRIWTCTWILSVPVFPGTVTRTVPVCPAKIRFGTPNAPGFFQVTKKNHISDNAYERFGKTSIGTGQPSTNHLQDRDRLSSSGSGLGLRRMRNGYVKKGQQTNETIWYE